MNADQLLKKPKGISAHNFSPCNTYGGRAYRNWYMLMKHKGIFIGFHNHDWCVLASSDPSAEWKRGCQNARAFCDPRPFSPSGATLIPIHQLPKEAQPLALKWVEEAIAIAREKIARFEKEKEEEERKKRAEKEETYKKKVADPWMGAVKAEAEQERRQNR